MVQLGAAAAVVVLVVAGASLLLASKWTDRPRVTLHEIELSQQSVDVDDENGHPEKNQGLKAKKLRENQVWYREKGIWQSSTELLIDVVKVKNSDVAAPTLFLEVGLFSSDPESTLRVLMGHGADGIELARVQACQEPTPGTWCFSKKKEIAGKDGRFVHILRITPQLNSDDSVPLTVSFESVDHNKTGRLCSRAFYIAPHDFGLQKSIEEVSGSIRVASDDCSIGDQFTYRILLEGSDPDSEKPEVKWNKKRPSYLTFTTNEELEIDFSIKGPLEHTMAFTYVLASIE